MSMSRSLKVVFQELLHVSMPEMLTLRIRMRCTPLATGSPTQRPASAVPFDAPGVLRLTPSTEMSLIELMTFDADP